MRTSENRGSWLTVRLTEDEVAEVKKHADACGLSASELIRRRVLGQRLPKGSAPAVNLEAWRDLSKLIGNVNQVAKHANEQRVADGRAVLDLVQIKALLQKVDDQVQKLRLQLLGADSN